MPGIEAISGLGVDALALYRQLPQYAPLEAASRPGGVDAVGAARSGSDAFGAMITEKLGAAVELQHGGAAAAQALATGQAEDISAATIAVQKANISLQLVGALRNKALEAYQDVMRMQV